MKSLTAEWSNGLLKVRPARKRLTLARYNATLNALAMAGHYTTAEAIHARGHMAQLMSRRPKS
jgi:hypothetical protein